MQLGIFAKTFVRDSIEENLDAVRASGFECTQYNLICAGLPTLPDEVDSAVCQRIQKAHRERGLRMAAISGTFNIIHPDVDVREANFARLATLAQACRELGTSLITLCTGTLDRDNMWRSHPENQSAAAWSEMMKSMRRIVSIAETAGVLVGIEPEVNNVVDSAARARRLLDELESPAVKVVIDPANLYHAGQLGQMHEVLDAAFDQLGSDIAVAHAKDLRQDGDAGNLAAGEGVLDYDYYLKLLRQYNFTGPLITHGLNESQVPKCCQFLRGKLGSAF